MMRGSELQELNEAKRALESLTTVDEAVNARSKADALRVYAKSAGESLEMQNLCAEIRIRAEIRAGELLLDLPNESGLRTDLTSIPRVTRLEQAVKEAGINTKQSYHWRLMATLNRQDPEAVERHIAETKEAGKELTSAGVLRLARRAIETERRRSIKTPPFPQGKYRTIVVDPPWPLEKRYREVAPMQVLYPYPTMNLNEIANLPIGKLAFDEGCHLYLWTPQSMIPVAIVILTQSWGFQYQCVLTWVKKTGYTPFSWMYTTEHVLFGHVGSLPLLRKGLRLDFTGKAREHSRKPDEFYDLVRKASPEPRIDVFSREPRDGFDQYGDETGFFSHAADHQEQV